MSVIAGSTSILDGIRALQHRADDLVRPARHGEAAVLWLVEGPVKFVLSPVSLLAGPPMKTEADAKKWSDSTFQSLAQIFAFVGHSEREIGLDSGALR